MNTLILSACVVALAIFRMADIWTMEALRKRIEILEQRLNEKEDEK